MCTALLLHWYFYLASTWKNSAALMWDGRETFILKFPMKQKSKKLEETVHLFYLTFQLNLSIFLHCQESPTWCRASGQQACRSHQLIHTRETTTAAGPGHLPALLDPPNFSPNFLPSSLLRSFTSPVSTPPHLAVTPATDTIFHQANYSAVG